MVGGRIGEIDTTTPFQGDMVAVFLFDHFLTTLERATFLAACYDFFGIVTQANTKIIWDGDSITEHSDAAENAFGYGFVRQTYPLLTKPVHMYNCGVGGARLGTGLTNFSTAIAPFYDASYARNIFICGKKTNDLGADGRTAAAVHADEMAWCAAARATGPNAIVLVPELLPQYDIDATKFADYRSRQATWATYCDGLIPFGSSPDVGPFGSNLNGAYYPDHLHLNSAGAAFLAPISAAAINPWLV
jgi:lysophospholipase L1-like esterase